jgi:hypothetical protein
MKAPKSAVDWSEYMVNISKGRICFPKLAVKCKPASRNRAKCDPRGGIIRYYYKELRVPLQKRYLYRSSNTGRAGTLLR